MNKCTCYHSLAIVDNLQTTLSLTFVINLYHFSIFVTFRLTLFRAIVLHIIIIQFKWLDVNKLCLNLSKSKFLFFQMPQKRVPNLLFNIDRMHIEQVTEFNFLGLIIDSNLNWKAHLNAISTKISRIIGLLHKLKYIFPKQVLHSIYNSLIMPHLNYSLLAWGIESHKIEQLQKKAIRVLYSKSPIAHTESLFIKMSQPKLSDLYTC